MALRMYASLSLSNYLVRLIEYRAPGRSLKDKLDYELRFHEMRNGIYSATPLEILSIESFYSLCPFNPDGNLNATEITLTHKQCSDILHFLEKHKVSYDPSAQITSIIGRAKGI